MADRWQITGGLPDGPFAWDYAIAAAAKGTVLARDADFLVAPDHFDLQGCCHVGAVGFAPWHGMMRMPPVPHPFNAGQG